MSQTESGTDDPVHVESEDQFEDLIGSHDVVLVDYWAEWCGPCKMLEPTVDEIAAESDALVLKVDIDEHQSFARDQGIRSVPTLEFYADGQQAERVVGVQDKEDLLDVVERLA